MKHVYKEVGCKPPVALTGAGAVLGAPHFDSFLCVRVAGNEQKPLDFNSEYVKAGRGPIKTFDYALEGDQDNFAIERKSLSDFIQSVVLSKSWKHELAKIERARAWLLPIEYVLECTFDDIATYDYMQFHSGRVSSGMVYRRWAELTYDLGVTVTFAGSRAGASYAVALILKRRLESIRAKQ